MRNSVITKNCFRGFIIAFIVLMISACSDSKPNIVFEQFRVILPPGVASGTAAYGVITNTGSAADTLIDITSNAGTAMLHKTEIESGIAKMTHVSDYVLKPNSQLVLKPMSYHLMLMNIDHKIIKENGKVVVSFKFEKSGILKLEVPVTK